MTRLVRFEPAARLELAEAADWYDEQRRGLGSEFLDTIDRAVEDARRRCQPGAAIAGVDEVRAVRVARFPYLLVVASTTTEIIILAVIHERRRPAYWIDRLPS